MAGWKLPHEKPQRAYNDDLGDFRCQSSHQAQSGALSGCLVQTAALFFQYSKNQWGEAEGHHAMAVWSSNVTTALAGFRVSSMITQVGLRRRRRLSRNRRTASSLFIVLQCAVFQNALE
jgi:hypothetical protein